MKTAIIVWSEDPAGMNIKDQLVQLYKPKQCGEFEAKPVLEFNEDVKLYEIKDRHVTRENLDKDIEADFFLFATTHRSESKIPSLSVHPIGNWTKAELGGQDRKLCLAPACMLKFAMLKLIELGKTMPDVEIVQEATHHGPCMEKPVMFIEIGSEITMWENKQAGKIIAKTIYHILFNKVPTYQVGFGIGGMHTTPNFKKVIERTNYAMGHVCPKYMLEHLDEELIKQALEKTVEDVDLVILDWKGLKTKKQRVVDMLNELNIQYKKSKDLY